jgi:hypothetical protein
MWRIDTTPRSAYLICVERIPVVTSWEGAIQRAMKAGMMALALVVLAASMVVG